MKRLGKLGALDDNIVAHQTLAVNMRTPISPSHYSLFLYPEAK